MGKHLKVDPATLHTVGQDLHTAADDSTEAFGRSHAGASAAADGLFSGSRQALQAKVDQWKPTTAAIVATVREHGSNLHTSAALYNNTDGDNSTALYVAGETPHRPLNLDI
ncbi:type VII secretion target [Williamsia sp.]|uniref:type VII secretion target n=1 Tax=Williamsia sp. TaxID=1872085 RepID=UPI001A2265C9|nr:type VII secretion target [Williamsia sp.]MBJ7291332.1 hypothetical protein [Williamsia sp.]